MQLGKESLKKIQAGTGFLFATAKVASITVMIFFRIILHPAVLIYDFHVVITSVTEVFSKVYSAQFPSRLFSLMVCFPKVAHVIILLRTVSFKFSIIPADTYA